MLRSIQLAVNFLAMNCYACLRVLLGALDSRMAVVGSKCNWDKQVQELLLGRGMLIGYFSGKGREDAWRRRNFYKFLLFPWWRRRPEGGRRRRGASYCVFNIDRGGPD